MFADILLIMELSFGLNRGYLPEQTGPHDQDCSNRPSDTL